MAAEDRDLEECWDAVRPRTLTTKWHPPSRPLVEQWVEGLGQETNPVLSVKGPSPLHRMEVYRWICPMAEGEPCKDVGSEWIDDPWGHLVKWVGGVGPWNLLWELLDVKDFVVEEPLRGLVDQGFLFTEFYQALWEVRFLLRESTPNIEGITDALIRWMTLEELSTEDHQVLGRLRLSRPLQSDEERLDTMFFLLALARQNGIAKPTIVIYDELGKAVRQGQSTRRKILADLLKLISAAKRWNRLGSALGLVAGFEPGVLTPLRRYNPKLGKEISGGFVQGDSEGADRSSPGL